MFYAPNHATIVEEEIDSEVIVINLSNGKYYSLCDEAAWVWRGLKSGNSVQQLVEDLTVQTDADSVLAKQSLDTFVAELVSEELLVAQSSPNQDNTADLTAAQGAEKRVFRAPVLQLFTDMQELLLLDPIHEVASEGWPATRPGEK